MAYLMFPAWRLQLREARLAVKDGRWDEAAEMLSSEALREFWPAKKLSQKLAEQLAERARQRIESGQSVAGWRDLDRAARLGLGEAQVGEFRDEQSQRRLDEVIDLLSRGEAAAARQALDRMDQRRLGGHERRSWQLVAQYMEKSELAARKGEFPAAIESLEQAQRLLPLDETRLVRRYLSERLTRLAEASARQQKLDGQLHSAVANANWNEALRAAEALLELAPQHSAALRARQKAWQAVGMEVTIAHYPSPGAHARRLPWQRPPLGSPAASTNHARNGQADTVTERKPGKRVVAWIDSVGGFLICTGDEIVLGQPAPDGTVDVPILGDLSRRHAVIRRDREAYVLTPLHRTAVDGRTITEPTVLRDKATITLGGGVQITFRKPHALSATAVLKITSHHRTEPAVDSIVLMSESCILGPAVHSHVRCRDWETDLVLFRRGEDLMCRTQAPVEIDGQTCIGQAAVAGDCRIESEDFALSLEEI
jgi:tetratricopeptide (TPR) repeat protein